MRVPFTTTSSLKGLLTANENVCLPSTVADTGTRHNDAGSNAGSVACKPLTWLNCTDGFGKPRSDAGAPSPMRAMYPTDILPTESLAGSGISVEQYSPYLSQPASVYRRFNSVELPEDNIIPPARPCCKTPSGAVLLSVKIAVRLI